jgi:hypothetical protein
LIPSWLAENLPVIRVRIDNKKVDMVLMLQTGSEITLISQEMAKRLTLPKVVKGVQGVRRGKFHSFLLARPRQIALGEIIIPSPLIAFPSDGDIPFLSGPRGILGTDLFAVVSDNDPC